MEKIKYKGVDGVFISNNEFETIKQSIAKQKKLTIDLLMEIAPNSNFDGLMALKYKYFE